MHAGAILQAIVGVNRRLWGRSCCVGYNQRQTAISGSTFRRESYLNLIQDEHS